MSTKLSVVVSDRQLAMKSMCKGVKPCDVLKTVNWQAEQ